MTFAYNSPAHRLVFGWGCRAKLADELAQMGCARPMLVCSPRAASTPEVQALVAALSLKPEAVFPQAVTHAPMNAAHEGAERVRALGADVLISFGGGSPGDLTKGIALAVAEQGVIMPFVLERTRDGRVLSPTSKAKKLPIVAIPTTVSGAEVTPGFALTDERGKKILFRDASLCPALLVYDPELMTGVPVDAMTASAMNSLAHGAEAFYSKGRSPISDMFAAKSLPLVHGAMKAILDGRRTPEVYADLALGAYCAGVAIVNARTGLHHSICHKLAPAAGITHGLANSIMLTRVLAFNRDHAKAELEEVARLIGREDQGVEGAIAAFRNLPIKAGLPTRLRDVGVDAGIFPELAERILTEPGLTFNPRPVTEAAEIREVLQAAW